jgi:uncharacterized membrane protein YcaP (DUF421 family)
MDWVEFLRATFGDDDGALTSAQMSARAVAVFAYGVVLVRLAGKRLFGKWGAMDIIVSVIIGSNLSRALTGNAPLGQAMVASAVLVGLHAALASLAARVDRLGPLLKGRACRVVENGRLDHEAMRRHGVGQNDLEAALRAAGLKNLDDVEEVWIERNGDVNVIKR